MEVKLSVFTEYAIRTLLHLAQNPNHYVTLRSVAETYEISRNHLMKVAIHLGAEGYITTLRGQHGGMRLKMPAADIRLGQVIHRAEHESRLVTCWDTLPTDSFERRCHTAEAIQAAYQVFIDSLNTYSIADLLPPAQPGRSVDIPSPVLANYAAGAA
jgi:Rrf2 family transcriptional regulator, nitric oxide-sensitive transcriptional repressor